MTSNATLNATLTTISSIQKLTVHYPKIIDAIQNIQGLRVQRDNSVGEMVLVVTHENFSNKMCTIKILGLLNNNNSRIFVELRMTDNGIITTETKEVPTAYDTIKSFFTSIKEVIINKLPREYGVKDLKDHRPSGGYCGLIQLAGIELDVIFNSSRLGPSDLEKMTCEFRMVGDNIWEKCVGITSFINKVDEIVALLNGVDTTPTLNKNVPSLQSASGRTGINLDCSNDVMPKSPVCRFGLAPTNTPVGVPISNLSTPCKTNTISPICNSSASGVNLRVGENTNGNNTNVRKTTATLDVEEDSVEGFVNNLSPSNKEIIKNFQTCQDFEEFKDKYCNGNPRLTAFVDKFSELGFEITQYLLMCAGYHH